MHRLITLFLLLLLAGCALPPSPSVTPPQPSATLAPALSATVLPSPAPTATPSPLPAPTGTPLPATPPTATPFPPPEQVPTLAVEMEPDAWQSLPVIPQLTPRQIEILRAGIQMGRDPRAFAKLGDCESRTSWFLGDFDHEPERYDLGPYAADLAPVVAYYQGSFDRLSLAARPGFTAASLLSRLWSSPPCEKDEVPLACELRESNPLSAFILLGTNDGSNPVTFEGHMRKIITYTLSQGVLPILGTKADNVEGDHAINRSIARLAAEYDIPLWNYWAAVQSLPDQGLQPDGAHLTFAANFFNDEWTMQHAWPVRNLNALQVLRVVMDHTLTIGENNAK